MRCTAPSADRPGRLRRKVRRAGWTCLLIGLACGGCLRATAFECDDDQQCVRDGDEGRCEDLGVCSYPDSECDGGRAYSPNAGSLAGQCLPVEASTDMATSGSTSSSAPTCDDAATDGCMRCTSFDVDAREFVACAEPRTFSDAEAACSARGLALASVHSPAESDAIGKQIAWPDAYWIGLSDRELEAEWAWVDGSTVDYLAWAPGEPDDIDSDEDCVSTVSPGAWAVQRCGLPNGYVCATPP